MVLPLSPLFHQLFNQVALASMVLGMKMRSAAPTFSRMPLASRTSLASSTSTLPSVNSSKSVLKEEAEETELNKEESESALLTENVLLRSDVTPAKSGWLNGVLNNSNIAATDVKRPNISNLVCADDQEKPVDIDVTLRVPT